MLQIIIANHVNQGLHPTPPCSIVIVSFIMNLFTLGSIVCMECEQVDNFE